MAATFLYRRLLECDSISNWNARCELLASKVALLRVAQEARKQESFGCVSGGLTGCAIVDVAFRRGRTRDGDKIRSCSNCCVHFYWHATPVKVSLNSRSGAENLSFSHDNRKKRAGKVVSAAAFCAQTDKRIFLALRWRWRRRWTFLIANEVQMTTPAGSTCKSFHWPQSASGVK